MNPYQTYLAIGRLLGAHWRAPATNHASSLIDASDWEQLALAASSQLVSPALYCAARSQNLLQVMPAHVGNYLAGLYELNVMRNRELWAQALAAVRQLNSVGIEPIFLKGLAGLAANLYPDIGERVIGDIDLLVTDLSEVTRGYELLRAEGYESGHAAPLETLGSRKRQHLPALMNPEFPVAIELHWRFSKQEKIQRLLPVHDLVAMCEKQEVEGARFLIPSPATRLLHNFAHCAIHDKTYLYGLIHLRQLADFFRLTLLYPHALDWPELLSRSAQQQFSHAFQAYLLASQKILGHPWPEGLQQPSTLARLWWVRAQLTSRYRWCRRWLPEIVRKMRGLTPRMLRRWLLIGISG